MCQGGMSEQRSWMLNTGKQWATGILLGASEVATGQLAELKCWARAGFRYKMKYLRGMINEDQLGSQSMLSKLQRGECNEFWIEIKALYPKKELLPLTVGGISFEINIASLWKDFSAIANSVGFTDHRDQVINALGTVPGHNDVNNIHELRQIVRRLKNNEAVINDGIPSEVYKFASDRLLTIMSIFLSGSTGCMLRPTGRLVAYQ